MSQLSILLTLQNFAGIISLAGALVVIAVVVFLIATSTRSEDKVSAKNKVYKIRGGYFWGLSVLLIVILFASLQLLPYPDFRGEAHEVVTVTAIQWRWEMASGIASKKSNESSGKNEISLPANKKIKFIVTSNDVNHNFAIYNSKGVLLTQTQAMPQYKNELQYVFIEEGDYSILCLEYCGLAHAFMMGTIHVY